MTGEALRDALARFSGLKIAVVGDLMLDEYVWGDVSRISPDAPVPVVALRRRSHVIGGAGNVAHNIAVAGGRAVLFGVIGNDAAGDALESLMREQSLDTVGLVRDPSRPTTVKTRVVARGQQLLRLDEERAAPLPVDVRKALLDRLARALPDCAALLISDYAKGVIDATTFAEIRALAKKIVPNAPLIVDPKSSDFAIYRGATAITPNRGEAEAAAGFKLGDDDLLARAGEQLRKSADAEYLLITLGERGMALAGPKGALDRVAAEAREVFDVTGAGDTVLAYFGLGLAAGMPADDAARIANAAAGIVVGKVGTAAVSPAEILSDAGRQQGTSSKQMALREAVARLEHERSLGRRIVFTNGCFDLLHAGHVQLLESARALGDVLVVALNSDASIRRLKGEGRPVVGETDRVRMMCALDAVGIVIVFDEDTPLEAIQHIRPDVLVKGGDYEIDTIVGASLVQGYGGRVATIPLVAGLSTTGLLETIRGREPGR